MRCGIDHGWRVGIVAAAVVAGCGGPGPSAPSPPASFVGVWRGTMTSDVAGAGALVVTFETQTETPSATVVRGTSSRQFTDPRFSGAGTVSATVLPGGDLGVVFERMVVPCPAEAGGAGAWTVSGTLRVTDTTLRGRYIAGPCPGGAIELTRP